MKLRVVILLVLILNAAACENPIKKAARNAGYSAYELVGVEKRDLLKRRVDNAKEEQQEAGEDFQDALAKLKAVYGFEGGNVEKQYNSLKSSYEEAKDQSQDVKESIQKVETVAKDLFNEWEKEIDTMQTASLKDRSRRSLADTQSRYAKLHSNLKAAEERMDPVLQKLGDQVLFLKHNLNSQALASLKKEETRIQGEVNSLIAEMNKSIQAADEFIKRLE